MRAPRGRISVVVGGQFGSEAKGHVAAKMAAEDWRMDMPHVAVRVAGPNAGHTVIDKTGHRFAFRQLPVAAVVHPLATLIIAAGSEVEYEVLQHEIELCESRGYDVRSRLFIDSSATVLTQAHKDAEAFNELQKRLGSTQKGIGAARSERIYRRAALVGDQPHRDAFTSLGTVTETKNHLNSAMESDFHILIEGTQGWGLGLHAGYYPKCTSSDCRAIDFLGMAGVNPWHAKAFQVIVVARVYPIRVAGDSGPLFEETTWKELGLPEEHTTVTKKVRRVGQWDPILLWNAIVGNGGPGHLVKLVITMADQRFPELAGLDGDLKDFAETLKASGAAEWLDGIQQELQTEIVAIGTGPNTMILA